VANYVAFGQRLEIYGFVFDKYDSLPIYQVKVCLYNDNDSILQTIFSEEKGQFIFNKTNSGVYYITIDEKEFLIKKINDLKFTGLPNCALRILLTKRKY
jgi:hypothetical protein